MTNKVYDEQKPLVATYGTNAPRAAEFGKGARDLSEVKEATAMRREQKPGRQFFEQVRGHRVSELLQAKGRLNVR